MTILIIPYDVSLSSMISTPTRTMLDPVTTIDKKPHIQHKSRRRNNYAVPLSQLLGQIEIASTEEEIDYNTILHLLPDEIMTMVASYLSPADLLALSLANKSLKATMIPYRDELLCQPALSGDLSLSSQNTDLLLIT